MLFMLDRGAEDNFLLDDREFDNKIIDAAVMLTVDKYNTTEPFCDTQTVLSFPFRYELMLGVCSTLLRSKAINMARNSVDYQTKGGVTVDENRNYEAYMVMAKEMAAEFTDRVRKIKSWINMNQGYGSVGSIYSILNLGVGDVC